MAKKLFYSMGEVSEMFDVNPSLLRFWESKFSVLRPKKNAKGNRLYSEEDLAQIKLIYHLVNERGMTLDGAARALKQNKPALSRDAELRERLLRVRTLLEEVRAELHEGAEAPSEEAPRSEGVQVIETAESSSSKRTPRRKKEEGTQELFAFYEQSLF